MRGMEVSGLWPFPFVLAQGEVKSFCIPGPHLDNDYTFVSLRTLRYLK